MKRDIKRVLAKYGVWYYMPVQNGFGRVGIPDFVCVYHGRFMGIEAKAPGAEPTPNQVNVGMQIMEHGGVWLVISDAKDLEEYFESLGDELREAVWQAVHPSPGSDHEQRR